DALGRQRSRPHQELGVPLRIDVVGDGGDVVTVAHRLAERVHQRGLAGTHRTSDADAKRTSGTGHERYSLVSQVRKRRVYWVSCNTPVRSARQVALATSSSGLAN